MRSAFSYEVRPYESIYFVLTFLRIRPYHLMKPSSFFDSTSNRQFLIVAHQLDERLALGFDAASILPASLGFG